MPYFSNFIHSHFLFFAIVFTCSLFVQKPRLYSNSFPQFFHSRVLYYQALHLHYLYLFFSLQQTHFLHQKQNKFSLFSCSLSLSLSLTAATVLSILLLLISSYPPFFLKFLFILHQHVTFDKYFFYFFRYANSNATKQDICIFRDISQYRAASKRAILLRVRLKKPSFQSNKIYFI